MVGEVVLVVVGVVVVVGAAVVVGAVVVLVEGSEGPVVVCNTAVEVGFDVGGFIGDFGVAVCVVPPIPQAARDTVRTPASHLTCRRQMTSCPGGRSRCGSTSENVLMRLDLRLSVISTWQLSMRAVAAAVLPFAADHRQVSSVSLRHSPSTYSFTFTTPFTVTVRPP